MNSHLIQRIKPIKQAYASQPFSKSKRCKLDKGNRGLTGRTTRLNEKPSYSKNLRSLDLRTPGTPLAVQKLKSQLNIQSLYIDMSIQQVHHLHPLLKLLKVFKNLRIMSLYAYGFNIATEENRLWLERLFKLCRRQLIIIFPL